MWHLVVIYSADQNVVVPAKAPIDDHANTNSPEHNYNYIENRILGWFYIGPAVKLPEGSTDSFSSDIDH